MSARVVPSGRGTAPARVDGRTARAERTRRAMVDALLSLIGEGDLKASPERIVERAGVSIRTLWTTFKDLEGLYAAASVRLTELQREQYQPVPLNAPLAQRVRMFCEQRAKMLEIAAPAARATQIRLPFSAQLRRNVATARALTRDEIERVFAAELAAAGAQREALMLALLMNTSWPSWSMLRDEFGLELSEATAVMIRAVGSLVGSQPQV